MLTPQLTSDHGQDREADARTVRIRSGSSWRLAPEVNRVVADPLRSSLRLYSLDKPSSQ